MWRISQTIALVFTIFVAAAWVHFHQRSLTEKGMSLLLKDEKGKSLGPEKIVLSDEEWKRRLTEEQYHILREKGTEPAYSGKLWNNKEEGTYLCAACDLPLFSSKAKYDSETGWPSFWEPINQFNIDYQEDFTLFSPRLEVLCARCGSHLGHVFEDGPPPTGLRYCINSLALKFEKRKPEVSYHVPGPN